MNGHLKALNERIIIRGIVKSLTALHIGWQRSFDPVDSDSPVIKDPRGNPFVPGSSFKGILRSFVEGFLGGAEFTDRSKQPCFPTDNNPCIDEEKLKEIENQEQKTEYILDYACPVCRVFGGPQLGSKIKIKDMPVDLDEWHESFLRIRDGVVIDRESRSAKNKGKYDFEIVSPGTPFIMEIVADNLTEAEKGMVFVAFELISQGFGSLGGNVSRGTGRIAISIDEIESLKPGDFFKQFKANNGVVKPRIIKGEALVRYMEEAKNSFVNDFNPEVA